MVDPDHGPEAAPRVDPTGVVLHPEGGGAIATVLGGDPATVRARLEDLLPDPGTGTRVALSPAAEAATLVAARG